MKKLRSTAWFGDNQPLLSGRVFDAAPEEVRKCVLYSLLAWFVLDSAGSVASGNTSNAFINVLVLFIAVATLWFPATVSRNIADET